MPNQQLIIVEWLIIAVVFAFAGIVVGLLIVFLITLTGRRKVVDSLISPNNIIGLSGTVEVPFDQNSRGKIRVNIRGSTLDLLAYTDAPQAFNPGDRVFIVEMKDNKVWVIPEEYLKNKLIDEP